MTSRSATRGNGQLTGSLHRGSTHDYLPQSFQTFASAANELTPSRYAPPAVKARTGLRGAPGKNDHTSFSAGLALKARQLTQSLSDVCFVVGLVLFAISGPIAILTFFIMLFIEF